MSKSKDSWKFLKLGKNETVLFGWMANFIFSFEEVIDSLLFINDICEKMDKEGGISVRCLLNELDFLGENGISNLLRLVLILF